MRLVQWMDRNETRRVGVPHEDGRSLRQLAGETSVYALALESARTGWRLEELVRDRLSGQSADYDELIEEGRLLPPLDHPDPARCLVSGTGLTHLGSAESRDAMHARLAADEHTLSDSMKMFKLGLEGGKPDQGVGVPPEWFYKGDGRCVVPPGQALEQPDYAEDGGEEAELVGLYVIGDQGEVLRVGFALGNEYSDHVLEQRNYLYLAHSKLRRCSFGPEVRLGPLPERIEGRVRVRRGDTDLWAADVLTGEGHMTHAISNIEHHHFKYPDFRRPGDVHVHYFGAAALSYSAGVAVKPGDVFEIEAAEFGRALRNPVVRGPAPAGPVGVRAL